MQASDTSVQRDASLLLYFTQRISGALLAILLFVHLLTVLYAIHDELTVAEITVRLQDSMLWLSFYGFFVLAAVIHSMIGLRNIFLEMTSLHQRFVDTLVSIYIVISLYFGFQALRAFWLI